MTAAGWMMLQDKTGERLDTGRRQPCLLLMVFEAHMSASHGRSRFWSSLPDSVFVRERSANPGSKRWRNRR
jgi:hypothetical protein